MASIVPIIIILIAGVSVLGIIFVIILSKSRKDKENGNKKSKKDKNSLVRDANRKLSQNPRDPEALRTLADIYYDEGKWEKAQKTYAILIDLCATHSEIDEYEVTLRYGLSSMKLKNYEEAYTSLMIAKTMRQDVF